MDKITKRAVIYARCSTREQNTEAQITELRRYCLARNFAVIEEIVDEGFSGATDDRPGLKNLIKITRTRDVDIVIVVKLDRLFRSMKHLLITLEELKQLSVEFISIKDQIDLTTSAGVLMMQMLGAFAEFERSLINSRIQAGLLHAVSKGVHLGRPFENDYQKIRELRNQGKSYLQIQNELGVSKGAVCRAIATAPKSPSKTTLQAPAVTVLQETASATLEASGYGVHLS